MCGDAKDLRVWRLFLPRRGILQSPLQISTTSVENISFTPSTKHPTSVAFTISMVTDTVHRFTYCFRLSHKPTPDARLGERFVLRRPMNMKGVAYKCLVDDASCLRSSKSRNKKTQLLTGFEEEVSVTGDKSHSLILICCIVSHLRGRLCSVIRTKPYVLAISSLGSRLRSLLKITARVLSACSHE